MPPSTRSRSPAGGACDRLGQQCRGLAEARDLDLAVGAPARCGSKRARSTSSSASTRTRRTARGCRSCSYSDCVTEPDQAVANPGLCGPDREVEEAGHLGVRVAPEVRQLDGFALHLGEAPSALRTRRASSEAVAASAVVSWSTVWLRWWYVESRRLDASAHGPGRPPCGARSSAATTRRSPGGVVPAGLRQISRNASWVTSSACAGSRTTRRARPCTRAAVASYNSANAARSPRAERWSSSARSPGPAPPAPPRRGGAGRAGHRGP